MHRHCPPHSGGRGAHRRGAAHLPATLLNASITVVYATQDVGLWFVLSLLSGVVGGVPWVVSEIWINLVVEEGRRGRAVAVYSTLIALGLAAGPLVLQLVGVYGPRPFLVNAALGLLVILPLLRGWRLAPPIRPMGRGGFAAVLALAPVALLAALASGLGEQVAFSFLPIFAIEAGVSAETGATWLSAFVIGNLVLQWPSAGWPITDRRAVRCRLCCRPRCPITLLTRTSASSACWSCGRHFRHLHQACCSASASAA